MSYSSPESRTLTKVVADQLRELLSGSFDVTISPGSGSIMLSGVGINRGNAVGGFRLRLGREHALLPWRRDPITGQLIRLAEMLRVLIVPAYKDVWPSGPVRSFVRQDGSETVVGYQASDGTLIMEILRLSLP